jgi:DNA-binding LacI/PurR family transcriptional regulator
LEIARRLFGFKARQLGVVCISRIASHGKTHKPVDLRRKFPNVLFTSNRNCAILISSKRFDNCLIQYWENPLPTMQDVAKYAGVALSTVSYALNGTRPISEATRQRIFAAVEELGYRPHVLARGLASKRSKIIALLFSAPERGLGITELEFVTSALDTARENGYHLVLWSSEMRAPGELRKLLQQGLADGVIVMEVHLSDERIRLLSELDFPFSIIGRCSDTTGIAYADIDFEQTVRDAINYLAGLGHTHMAFLNQSQSVFEAGYGPAVRAKAGFEQAMQAVGLEGITRFCRPVPTAGYEVTHELLADNPDLTALIVMNDRIIPGVIQALTDWGWRIPDDFSLVTMVTSTGVAEMMIPPLTTLAPPTAELGRLGVELLLQQLEARGQSTPQALLPCRLIVGGSTGLCRRNSVPSA